MPFLSLLPFYRSPQSPGEQNNLFSTGRLGRDGHAWLMERGETHAGLGPQEETNKKKNTVERREPENE